MFRGKSGSKRRFRRKAKISNLPAIRLFRIQNFGNQQLENGEETVLLRGFKSLWTSL